MTKLLEWLSLFGVLFTIWFSLITNKIENSFVRDHYTFVLYSPVIFVLLFGVNIVILFINMCTLLSLTIFQLYAFTVVMYRVFTFNNCEDAAAELQKVHFYKKILLKI